MVKKNQIKINKPVSNVNGLPILMDRHWVEHTKEHLNEINSQLPIKKILDKKDHILVEFIDAKTATMFRLKYGEK